MGANLKWEFLDIWKNSLILFIGYANILITYYGCARRGGSLGEELLWAWEGCSGVGKFEVGIP